MHDDTFIICIRHRLLWWLPIQRFHVHLRRPLVEVSARDYTIIEQMGDDLGWWWLVSSFTVRDGL